MSSPQTAAPQWRLPDTDIASQIRHAPLILLPDRVSGFAMSSSNWSGYAVAGQPYTSAAGTWTIPSVTYFPYQNSLNSDEASSIWVGVGGTGLNDASLIQLGTAQRVSASGTATYSAWFEMLPANPVSLDPALYPVAPGDLVTASLNCTAPCAPNAQQTWSLSLTNVTENWAWSGTVNYTSSLASAEWIVEAATVNNSVSSLPNFGSAAFSGLLANRGNPTLSLAANGIIMYDPNGGTAVPLPLPVSTLQVSPIDNMVASGHQGGPFLPTSFQYQVSASSGSVDYSISGLPSWLSVSASSGTVDTAGSTVTLTLNANALSPGTYGPSTITFTNTANSQDVQSRTVTLTVNGLTVNGLTMQVAPATGIIASGAQGGPFSPSVFNYAIGSTTGSVAFSISGLPSWLTASSVSGMATTSPTTITLAVNASAIGLPPGTYNTNIAFTNITNGLGNQSLAATLTVTPTTSPPGQTNRTWVSGLGDDANDCSRTMPCLTLAGAFAKTAAGGEIDALDRGGFGTLTITKAITIDGGGFASILYAGSTGITITAGQNDAVTLRNLNFNGAGTGLNGIKFNSGGSLLVENCTIGNSTAGAAGLQFSPTSLSQMSVQDTLISNSGGGMLIQPSAGGGAKIALLRVQMNNNFTFGLMADGTGGPGTINVAFTQSQSANNGTDGISAVSGPANVTVAVDRSALVGNLANGVRSDQLNGGTATVLVGGSTITGNNRAAFSASGGAVLSYRNNLVSGNSASDGTFSGVAPLH